MATLSSLFKAWGVDPSQWTQAGLQTQFEDITNRAATTFERGGQDFDESLADLYSGQAARGAFQSGATARKSDLAHQGFERWKHDLGQQVTTDLQGIKLQQTQEEVRGGGAKPKPELYQPEGVSERVTGRMDLEGGGHIMVGEQGGVFAQGGAPFLGSMFSPGISQHKLPGQTFVGIKPAPGGGYTLVDNAGHEYTFTPGMGLGG